MTREELNGRQESSGQEYFVHETAYVDYPCEIGSGTKIWHFCHIMKDARIGKNCIRFAPVALSHRRGLWDSLYRVPGLYYG